jgi:hypothetical protein
LRQGVRGVLVLWLRFAMLVVFGLPA